MQQLEDMKRRIRFLTERLEKNEQNFVKIFCYLFN